MIQWPFELVLFSTSQAAIDIFNKNKSLRNKW